MVMWWVMFCEVIPRVFTSWFPVYKDSRCGTDGRGRTSGTWGKERGGRSQWESGAGWNRRGLGWKAGWTAREGKIFPLVRYVSMYGRFYWGRLGSQAVGGTSDPFWDI